MSGVGGLSRDGGAFVGSGGFDSGGHVDLSFIVDDTRNIFANKSRLPGKKLVKARVMVEETGVLKFGVEMCLDE